MRKDYKNGAGKWDIDMDRKLYLELCQRVSILKSGICGVKENVTNDLKVFYGGTIFYPVAYELSFDNGQPQHRAILHDLKANCVVYAKLEEVNRYRQK